MKRETEWGWHRNRVDVEIGEGLIVEIAVVVRCRHHLYMVMGVTEGVYHRVEDCVMEGGVNG